MKSVVYTGIDPDSKGAIAFIGEGTIKIYDRADPVAKEVLQGYYKSKGVLLKVCIEGASVSPQQGVVSAGKQMENSGFWKGRLNMIDIEPIVIYAVTWRKETVGDDMPVRPDISGMDRKAQQQMLRKHRANIKTACVKKACELFPSIVAEYMNAAKPKREARSEAALLALYCQRLHTGQLGKMKKLLI